MLTSDMPNVELLNGKRSVLIRYTTNGSTPTENSPIFDESQPILINGNATIKAKSFYIEEIEVCQTRGWIEYRQTESQEVTFTYKLLDRIEVEHPNDLLEKRLDFGTYPLNAAIPLETVTIRNTGNAMIENVSVEIFNLDGLPHEDFTILRKPIAGIPVGGVASFDIQPGTSAGMLAGKHIAVVIVSGSDIEPVPFAVVVNVGEMSGATVSGTVSSYNPNNATIVELIKDGVTMYTYTTPAALGSGQVAQPFNLSGVVAGAYSLKVTKGGHLSYTKVTLVVDDSDIDFGVITLIPGDINGDGQIDSDDLGILTDNYRKKGADITNSLADINGDGQVDSDDLGILTDNYRKKNVIDT